MKLIYQNFYKYENSIMGVVFRDFWVLFTILPIGSYSQMLATFIFRRLCGWTWRCPWWRRTLLMNYTNTRRHVSLPSRCCSCHNTIIIRILLSITLQIYTSALHLFIASIRYTCYCLSLFHLIGNTQLPTIILYICAIDM